MEGQTKEKKEDRRSRLGYGASYRKGAEKDLGAKGEIGAVLGGQVWLVKPDKKAEKTNPCLWMQSGAVDYKTCNNFYDCTTCKYDLGMKKKVEQGKQISWQDAMRARSGLDRVCRHSLTGRIAKRQCAYDFECSKCDFDQFFEDVWSVKTKTMPHDVTKIKGFDLPVGYYFHDGHTWARIESGGYIRVGMDDFSLKLFGSPEALDLPVMGKELDQGNAGWGFKRNDNRAEVLSPVSGVIVEVNSEIRERPEQAWREPYSGGWLFVLRNPDLKDTVRRLMSDSEAISWLGNEVTQLEHMIEQVAGPMASDGGFLGNDIYGNMPALGWSNLAKTFLKTA
jgi:glycine cleavage system H lipoate-binding protein